MGSGNEKPEGPNPKPASNDKSEGTDPDPIGTDLVPKGTNLPPKGILLDAEMMKKVMFVDEMPSRRPYLFRFCDYVVFGVCASYVLYQYTNGKKIERQQKEHEEVVTGLDSLQMRMERKVDHIHVDVEKMRKVCSFYSWAPSVVDKVTGA